MLPEDADGGELSRDGRVMDGKSILGILLLAASQGTAIEVAADGPDEEEAARVFEFSTSVRLLCLSVVAPFAESAVPCLIDRCRKLARSLQ